MNIQVVQAKRVGGFSSDIHPKGIVTIAAKQLLAVAGGPRFHTQRARAAPYPCGNEILDRFGFGRDFALELDAPPAVIPRVGRSVDRWVCLVVRHETLQSDTQLVQITDAR